METKKEQRKKKPTQLSGCQETGGKSCVPRSGPRQAMRSFVPPTPSLFPYASMQRNQSFILGLRCQYTPAPGRVSVLPTSGVLASWGYFPDDASRTSGTQGRPLHLWLVALATCKRPALPQPPEQKASGNVGGALPATLGTSLKVI